MEIRTGDLDSPEVIALLKEHRDCMARVSPRESCHALDLDGLRKTEITFWSVWNGTDLAGCGALKELDPRHGEIKSMRTTSSFQRKGVASRLLRHIIAESMARGYRRLSLETGAMEYFEPARQLYGRFGFSRCGPFGTYVTDPNSLFMTKEL